MHNIIFSEVLGADFLGLHDSAAVLSAGKSDVHMLKCWNKLADFYFVVYLYIKNQHSITIITSIYNLLGLYPLSCEIPHMRFYFILGYLRKLWPLVTTKSWAASGCQRSLAGPMGQLDILCWPSGPAKYLLLALWASKGLKTLKLSRSLWVNSIPIC